MVTWDELTTAVKEKPAAWFRGQRNPWPVRSRLHRIVQSKMGLAPDWDWSTQPPGFDETEYRRRFRELHRNLYETFRSWAWPLLPQPLDRWDLLFVMQHYGLPTRLIDFTQSFPFALYTALEKADFDNDDSPTIVLAEPSKLNKPQGLEGIFALRDESFLGHHPEGTPPPGKVPCTVAIGTPRSNARMVAQQAVFLLAGDSPHSLEQEFEAEAGAVIRMQLDSDAIAKGFDFLNLAGARRESLYFPDLDTVARDVLRDYDLATYIV